MRTARPDAENLRSYFFTDALEILATDEMNKIPDIFESVENRMPLAAGGVRLEAQIGVLHARVDGAAE